jgi:hypothetical protein
MPCLRWRGPLGRLFAAALFALLASTTAPGFGTNLIGDGTVPVARAQGDMDVGILTPGFTELPLSVQPGQQFVVTVATAAGARCVGTLEFRDHPIIELEAQAAPTGACSWTVTAPPTVRASTGIVRIDISRSGQAWGLVGTLWVSVVGESR